MTSHQILTFFKYALIGALVCLLAALLLAFCESLFPENKLAYITSVISIYIAGILLNYTLQKNITFSHISSLSFSNPFLKFIGTAFIGAIITTSLSYIMKYNINWPIHMTSISGPTSFVISSIIASIVTFYLNKKWVFKSK